MVIDTSAVVAILRNEPERRQFLEAIDAADACRMSAAALVEASIVIEARFGVEGVQALDRLLQRAGVDCFSYALATVVGEPLLFEGNDFSHTDVGLAVRRPPEAE